MSLQALSATDQTKLRNIVDNGIKTQMQIDDLRVGLRETIKAVSDELQIKPKSLRAAIRTKMKNSMEEQKETVDEVEEILHIVGR